VIETTITDGRRDAPVWFQKLLKRFDPCLRIRWGMDQAVPFPGWIIERKIPDYMRDRVSERVERSSLRNKMPGHWINERYADQTIVDEHGNPIYRRLYDMMPEWFEVYRLKDAEDKPVLELGEFVIDYLRQNYDRTVLGEPQLSLRYHAQMQREYQERQEKLKAERLDRVAEEVMDHKFEIFSDVMAFGGQASTVFKEQHNERDSRGTEKSGEKDSQLIRVGDGGDTPRREAGSGNGLHL
jgi:hypothetical protein